MHEKNEFDIATDTKTARKIILLIDDDEDEHEIFQSALKNVDTSINLVSAESCDEGLKMLKYINPDYIFVDVNMPRKNGMICLEEIKKLEAVQHVPVYMYSTGMNTPDGQKALQLGAIDYIIKPNSISSLSNLLKKIIS